MSFELEITPHSNDSLLLCPPKNHVTPYSNSNMLHTKCENSVVSSALIEIKTDPWPAAGKYMFKMCLKLAFIVFV